ncbi:MAG: class III poly(R)-hydroxyalkanoic acid synthase subunit PhaC [Deltaproteobacteria bacterium]|nr:class III poly(R)-hydroxyalkanoic acid synthase subunit PhaC [Deltaproteobacteria bacterium]
MEFVKIPLDRILQKMADHAEKMQDRLQKAKDVLLGSLDTEIATTPCEILYEEDRVRLKHYKPLSSTGPTLKTPLLVVYALVNRETLLDLQPGRSAVQNLVKEGLDVYMIDWGYATRKDRYLTIDDHVSGFMNNIVDFIRRRHRLPGINLMGVCMGGTFSIMYAALYPQKIKNLITTVTPSNFDTDKGLLHIWAKGIDADRITEAYGNIPGDMLNIAFLLLNPARLMIDKYVGFMENVDNKTFVENFVRMERWIFDSPDIPGETFRQFIKDCYQRNLLIQGKLKLGGRRVDLQKITMPLLNIYGRYDHLVPPEACELLTQRVGSKDVEDVRLDTGHIGIYVSSKSQKELVPKIGRWLRERDKVAREGRKKKDSAAPGTARKVTRQTKPPSARGQKGTAEGKENTRAGE